jgi:hypothetical protein
MDLQELFALATVALAAALLVLRWRRRKGTRTACGGSCDCPAGLQLRGQSDILQHIVQETDRTV